VENESLMRDLRAIQNALDRLQPNGMDYVKWFISFGSLLYIIRDKKLGLEFTQDIDISIIGPHELDKILNALGEDGFTKCRHIINDKTGETLYVDLKSPHGMNVDLFVWIKKGGFYFHTYDYMNEKPESGIPEKYHFKGTPAEYFEGEPYKYSWFEEISPLKIPRLYGTLLDYWYPNWYIPDSEFGVSRCQVLLEPSTCESEWP